MILLCCLILYCISIYMLLYNASGTFDVQHCDVHTDHTSYILVECTFAINSTAPGFVLIQDEHSQYTINTTLQRHEGDVSKGSVNITDLPTGEYRVTVYDQMEDYSDNISPAYLLQVINLCTTITLTGSKLFYSTLYGKSKHQISKINIMYYTFQCILNHIQK